MISNFEGYSFCESVHATGRSPWHVRQLTEVGPKPGGGIDTPTLCGIIYPAGKEVPGKAYTGGGGWDLAVPITWSRLNHSGICSGCQKALVEKIR